MLNASSNPGDTTEPDIAIPSVTTRNSGPTKIGVEVELLAPLGSDRKTLANTIAKQLNGSVKAFFHLDSEPSKVKGKPVFYHLTQAFEILDSNGKSIAHCVDDITIQHSLDKKDPPKTGWYRILSDDVRFLRLTKEHANADQPIDQSLKKLAEIFGVEAEKTESGVYRVADKSGASIALAAPLPGERERPCELVTTPLNSSDNKTLYTLLNSAKELKFETPVEGATHLHFDGDYFASPEMFLKVTRFLNQYRLVLRRLLNTNLNCRKIGDWSQDFIQLIQGDELLSLKWSQSQKRLSKTKVSKYCDFNLRNLIYSPENKHTLEIRILPATLEASDLYRAIHLFHTIFIYLKNAALDDFQHTVEPTCENTRSMLNLLTINNNDKQQWLKAFDLHQQMK